MNAQPVTLPAQTETVDLPDSIVITGIGLLTSLGTNIVEQTGRACAGESGIQILSAPELRGHFCKVGATVPPFDLAEKLRQPKNAKFMSRAVSMAVSAATDAVKSSGITWPTADPSRVALHVGSGQTGLEIDEFFKALSLAWPEGVEHDWKHMDARAARMIDRYFSLRTLSNAGLALVSSELGIQGPSANYVQSETASANALDSCYYDLVEDRCDLAMAGGYDCLLRPSLLMEYGFAGVLTRCEESSAYRPFDVGRDGIALGEGAAFLTLERARDAKIRGAEIFGEVHGIFTATSSSVEQPGQPDCSRTGTVLAKALAATGKPDFVVARGFGTPLADGLEAAALAEILPDNIPVTALKGYTGYLGAATALAELSLGLLAARNGIVPPIANCVTPEVDGLKLIVGQSHRLTSDRPLGYFFAHSTGGHATVIAASAWRNGS